MSYLRSRPDLISRFRRGDREALEEVYRAYLQRIRDTLRRGFILKKTLTHVPGLSSPDDLADALQEVFTRAFKREAREVYDGQQDYGAYLCVVARNVVITRYRKQGRELITADPLALDEVDVMEAHEGDHEQPWLDLRALEIARSYVSALDEATRAVHSARYVGALSQRDAARELGISRPKLRKLEDRMRSGLLLELTQAGLVGEPTSKPDTANLGATPTWTSRPRTS